MQSNNPADVFGVNYKTDKDGKPIETGVGSSAWNKAHKPDKFTTQTIKDFMPTAKEDDANGN